jgi:Cytochrome C'
MKSANLLRTLAALAAFTAFGSAAPAFAEDARQLVDMPAAARDIMRQAMIENLGTLNSVLGLLAEGKLKEAGDAAESGFGISSMGRHMGGGMGPGGRMATGPGMGMGLRGMGPGRYMPEGMRSLAIGMHTAASDFARAAAAGDRDKAMQALQAVTADCFACHSSFRTR